MKLAEALRSTEGTPHTRAEVWERRFDLPLLAGALVTVPLVVIEATKPHGALSTACHIGDWVIWVLFAAHLVVMLWVSDSWLQYLRREPIVAGVVILTMPFLPAGLGIMRVLRILRLLEFGPLLRTLFTVEGAQYAFVLAAVAMFAGAAAYSSAEHRNYATGLYWAIQTLTTVGYGDVSPVTTLGRIIACLLMVVGIGFFAIITGAIAQRFTTTTAVNEIVQEIDATDEAILAQIKDLGEQIARLEHTVRSRNAPGPAGGASAG